MSVLTEDKIIFHWLKKSLSEFFTDYCDVLNYVTLKESWTVKKVEHWRIYAFELWCWRRLLRVAWTSRRSNQSILKRSVLGVHWKDWCWSWNSNTLTTSCEELTPSKRPWCWERLRAGEGDNGGRAGWMASLTQWTWVWVDSGSWWWTGRAGELWFMGSQRVGHDWATELNWTELKAQWWCLLLADGAEHRNCTTDDREQCLDQPSCR